METSEKIIQLENEIKLLKNEIQAVLLDIRESVLSAENPFSPSRPAVNNFQAEIITQPIKEEKPVDNTPGNEIPENETPETNHKNNNGKNSLETTLEHLKQLEGLKQLEELKLDSFKQIEDSETEPPRFEACENGNGRHDSSLVAHAGLAYWVEESTKKLGKERTQALLEIAQFAGYLPSDIKDVLNKLTSIELKDNSYIPTARDYFDSLTRIAALSGSENNNNAALLYILSQGDMRG